jgi:hypothetical protein
MANMKWFNYIDMGLIVVGIIAASLAMWSIGWEVGLMGTGCLLIVLGICQGATK